MFVPFVFISSEFLEDTCDEAQLQMFLLPSETEQVQNLCGCWSTGWKFAGTVCKFLWRRSPSYPSGIDRHLLHQPVYNDTAWHCLNTASSPWPTRPVCWTPRVVPGWLSRISTIYTNVCKPYSVFSGIWKCIQYCTVFWEPVQWQLYQLCVKC